MFQKKQFQASNQTPSDEKAEAADKTISGSLSGKLTAVSFFGACSIVLLHANTFYAGASQAAVWTMTFFSKVMTAFAVPMFFAISGFLIAVKTDSGRAGGWFPSILKKRVRTLLVPYFVWCIIYILSFIPLALLKNRLLGKGLLENTSLVEPVLSLQNVVYLFGLSFSEYPALRVLWYVRNLFLLCLLTPLLFPVMRHRLSALLFLALNGILFLLFPTLFPFFSGPGFNLQGLLFFSIGIYLAEYPLKPDEFPYFRKSLPFLWVVLAVFKTWCLRNSGLSSEHSAMLLNACIVVGVGSVWVLYDMIPAFRLLGRLRVSKDSFFLYAFHLIVMDILIGSQVQDLLRSRLHVPELGIYFLRFLIPLALSLLTAEILKRLLPRFYGLLTGGR